MSEYLRYPRTPHLLFRKKRSIRRGLLQKKDLQEKRIAILGGSTTAEIRDMLELFLLDGGIRPAFYESEYNRYFEDIMFPNERLREFAPDAVYIHTSNVNITRYPSVHDTLETVDKLLTNEIERYKGIWDRVSEEYGCPVIQNNFELPHYRLLGNLDAYDIHGRSRYVSELNTRFSEEARKRPGLYLNDIHYLSSWFGLERWYDRLYWYSYKYAMSYEAIPYLADSVASIIKAIYGKNSKCLVLDLDNTLWGGVIGDDGLEGIMIGKETPESEAFTEFQQYIKKLGERGIILSVCSKNDEENAREGFSHPDSILSLDDFSVFLANWKPKHQNIRDVARILNIGIDSLVFADDNPAEREIVRAQEPSVIVPELGNDVVRYIDILDKSGVFETVSLSGDDLKRSSFYSENARRQVAERKFESYDDFLQSLEMEAEIKPFAPVYMERITQLTNKTNQFNLTTRRYTQTEMEAIADDDRYITLYGRLKDKFGDNGLVSVMIGEIKGDDLHIDLWLMSCRVLKRGMENAMLDRLSALAGEQNIATIFGYYYPTAKNSMVSGLFNEMGFEVIEKKEDNSSIWQLDVSKGYADKNQFIKITA